VGLVVLGVLIRVVSGIVEAGMDVADLIDEMNVSSGAKEVGRPGTSLQRLSEHRVPDALECR
jgi:hypothetical protein